MKTDARDYALLDELADYFEMLAKDSEAMALRGFGSKRENTARAKVWRDAAEDVRSIEITGLARPVKEPNT